MMLPQTCAIDECQGCSKRIQLFHRKYECPACLNYALCGDCVNYPVTMKEKPQRPSTTAASTSAASSSAPHAAAVTEGDGHAQIAPQAASAEPPAESAVASASPAAAGGQVSTAAPPAEEGNPEGVVVSVCYRCFKQLTKGIDFEQTVEVFGPDKGDAVSVLLVHGGGASRKMMLPLARFLSKEHGYRCIVPDLPGHGALVHVAPTMENCLSTINDVYEQYCAEYRGVLPVYLGATLGGYLGMELVGHKADARDRFSAAIFVSAAQTVGRGAGLTALVAYGGLSVMSHVTWAEQLSRAFFATTRRQKKFLDEESMQECFIQPGTYFTHARAVCAILRQCDSQSAMNRFYYPVLYITGDLDHRDMAEELVTISKEKEAARMRHQRIVRSVLSDLKVYPEVSYMLGHDKRTQNTYHQDVVNFLDAVKQQLLDARVNAV